MGKLSDVIVAVQNTADETDDMKLNSFVTVADATKVKVYMKNFGEFYNNQIEPPAPSSSPGPEDEPGEAGAAVAMLREKNADAAIPHHPLGPAHRRPDRLCHGGGHDLARELMEEIGHHHDHGEDEPCSCGHDHHHDPRA